MAPWITVLWYTLFTKWVIYYKFTFVWYYAKQGTTHRPMSNKAHCALSLAVRRTQTAEQSGQFHWQLFVMATSTEAGCCFVPLLLPPQNSLLTSLVCTPDSQATSATRISLMASTSSCIFFWPLLEIHNRLPHLDYYVQITTISDM